MDIRYLARKLQLAQLILHMLVNILLEFIATHPFAAMLLLGLRPWLPSLSLGAFHDVLTVLTIKLC